MSEALEVRAELLRLSRLLRREPDELAYLAELPSVALRELREQVTAVLFDSHATVLGKLVAASRLLPVALVAQLGERIFGATLSARVAGRLDPERAVEMADRLPVPFLADVATELDPRRASDVIARIPPDRVAAVSRELTARGEFVTMGSFVSHLPPSSIAAAVEAMDAAAMLEVAIVLERKDRLPDVIALLEPGRVEEMIAFAADSNLAEEALGLLDYMSEAQRASVMRMLELRERRSA